MVVSSPLLSLFLAYAKSQFSLSVANISAVIKFVEPDANFIRRDLFAANICIRWLFSLLFSIFWFLFFYIYKLGRPICNLPDDIIY